MAAHAEACAWCACGLEPRRRRATVRRLMLSPQYRRPIMPYPDRLGVGWIGVATSAALISNCGQPGLAFTDGRRGGRGAEIDRKVAQHRGVVGET